MFASSSLEQGIVRTKNFPLDLLIDFSFPSRNLNSFLPLSLSLDEGSRKFRTGSKIDPSTALNFPDPSQIRHFPPSPSLRVKSPFPFFLPSIEIVSVIKIKFPPSLGIELESSFARNASRRWRLDLRQMRGRSRAPFFPPDREIRFFSSGDTRGRERKYDGWRMADRWVKTRFCGVQLGSNSPFLMEYLSRDASKLFAIPSLPSFNFNLSSFIDPLRDHYSPPSPESL